jgi:hypothetical protein
MPRSTVTDGVGALAVRSPGAGHDIELVEQDLRVEFGGRLPEGDLAVLAIEEVRALGPARVHDYVAILAWRRARRRAIAMLEKTPGGPTETPGVRT